MGTTIIRKLLAIGAIALPMTGRESAQLPMASAKCNKAILVDPFQQSHPRLSDLYFIEYLVNWRNAKAKVECVKTNNDLSAWLRIASSNEQEKI